jgi:hypothetical protein
MRHAAILAAVAISAAMLAAACGSQHPAPHATAAAAKTPAPSSPSPSNPPGPGKFVADVRASGLFHGDVQAITDASILKIGRDMCNYFTAGGSYSAMILGLMKNKLKPTTLEATIVVDSAIRNLCPQFSSLVPAGAP